MDSQKILDVFGHIANAPGGIARLRDLILQLAISGKLTFRITGDTSAQTLLKRNAQAKNALEKDGRLKRTYPLPLVSAKEFPWRLPDGWCWTRLGTVTDYGNTIKVEFEDVNPDTWVLELEDIEKSTSRLIERVVANKRRFKSSKNKFSAGSILYGKLRPYLDKVLIAQTDGVCSTEIATISFYEAIDPNYLRWFLKSPFFINYANGSTYGMNLPRMGTDSARMALFAMPPLNEQAQIVAKVDELMALCDQLEKQQEARRALQVKTRKALIQTVASAAASDEVLSGWGKLTDNFADLFSSPEDVEDLRGLVCGLAVQGLVAQHVTTGESARELVEKLKSLKSELLSKGSLTRNKPVVPEAFEDTPFPAHWVTISLDEAISGIDAGWSPACLPAPRRDEETWGVLKTTSVQRMSFNAIEHKELPSSLEPRPQYELFDGDILVTRAGPKNRVGICCVAKNVPPRLMISDKLIRFHIVGDMISSDFVAMCITYGETGRILERLKSGMADSQMNISQDKLRSLPIPVPPYSEQLSILKRIEGLMSICDQLEQQMKQEFDLAERLATSCVSSITGIAVTEEEAELKAPQTELIAPLRIGKPPEGPAQAPLASILVRHSGALSAKDLWQRFGGEIDSFYAQLKHEVAKGWIAQPDVAEMRERESA